MRNSTQKQLTLALALMLSGAVSAAARAPLTAADSQVAIPTAFSAAEVNSGASEQQDWSALGDPVLTALIAEGWDANTDARAAIARLRMAEADVIGSRAARWPQGAIEVARQSGKAAPPDFAGGMSFEWELDLFGRLGAQTRAALASAQATRAELQVVRHLVAARIAQTWFALAGARQSLLTRREYLSTQETLVELTAILVDDGAVTAGELARSRAEAATRAAEALAAEEAVATLEAELAVLLGRTPGQWQAPDSDTLSAPLLVALQLPDVAQVLQARPDVQRARANLAVHGADAEAAAAARWPKLSLTGLLGFVAGDFGSLFSAGADVRQQSAALRWSPFAAPRLEAAHRRADAGMDMALADYDGVVLTAIQEVELSLRRQATAWGQVQARLEAVAESRFAAQVAQARFEEGASAYLEPLLARRDALAAELAAIQAIVEQRRVVVGIFRALGIAPQ